MKSSVGLKYYFLRYQSWWHSQVVRQKPAKLPFPSSNLGATFKFVHIAPAVRHLMLILVATPIGNLSDITFRAIEALKSCDYILAEDSRHSLILLSHYSIKKHIVSFHQFSAAKRVPKILADLSEGKTICLISDAGTPLISDPGFELVHACIENNIAIDSIPGPCALIDALSLSGLDTTIFQFIGFLPKTDSLLRKTVCDTLQYQGTTIAYESPKRLLKTISIIAEFEPQRKIVIAKELTKKFQTIFRGTAQNLAHELAQVSIVGEYVLLIDKNRAIKEISEATLKEELERFLNEGLSTKDAINQVAEKFQISKNLVYKLAHSPDKR